MALQFGVSFAGGEYEYVRARRWPFTIGRAQRNDLCLSNSALISRHHARILKEGDDYYLISQGRNPTYLNGEALLTQQPQPILPGDTIEFPDYTVQVRDTTHARTVTATVNVQAVTTTTIIIRRVASALNTHRWTVDGIFDWLQATRGRVIRVSHHQVELFLHERLVRQELSQRLAMLDQLVRHLDPQKIQIEITDPAAVAQAMGSQFLNVERQ